MIRVAATALAAILGVAYPVIVLWSLRYGARATSVVALAIVALGVAIRFRGAPRDQVLAVIRVPVGISALLLGGIVWDDRRFVLALPVLISGFLLVDFASSLRSVPVIERFARLGDPDLSEVKQRHCRRWTQRWCLFFALNGTIAGVLALTSSTFAWSLYSGLIAYVLMALMFGAERIERAWRFSA